VKNYAWFLLESVLFFKELICVAQSKSQRMEDSAKFLKIGQVQKQRVHVLTGKCPLQNESNFGGKLVKSFQLLLIVSGVWLFYEFMVQIVETIVLERVPSLQEDLILFLGKRVHFLNGLVVEVLFLGLFYQDLVKYVDVVLLISRK